MANTVSTGLNPLPMVVDHAGFTSNEGGQEPREEQIIGRAVEAWRDPKQGLMLLAHIPEERPEVRTTFPLCFLVVQDSQHPP
jgi:hypothetical protein